MKWWCLHFVETIIATCYELMIIVRWKLYVVDWLWLRFSIFMCFLDPQKLDTLASILCNMLIDIPDANRAPRCADQESGSLLVPIQAERFLCEATKNALLLPILQTVQVNDSCIEDWSNELLLVKAAF